MNGIYGMELQYESLIPVARPEDTSLSVGTVTFQIGETELPLDFNITECSVEGEAGSILRLNAVITDFEPQTYTDEYQKLGLTPADLTYGFFAIRYSDTHLTELYTEYFYTENEAYLPLTLKSACLLFQDGSALDYSDRISVFVLKQLAEVA